MVIVILQHAMLFLVKMILPWFLASRTYFEVMKKVHSKLHAQEIAKFHFTGSTRGFPSRVFDSYPILHLSFRSQCILRLTNIVFYVQFTVTDNSPFQDCPHPDDHTTGSTVTPGFKPFTV